MGASKVYSLRQKKVRIQQICLSKKKVRIQLQLSALFDLDDQSSCSSKGTSEYFQFPQVFCACLREPYKTVRNIPWCIIVCTLFNMLPINDHHIYCCLEFLLYFLLLLPLSLFGLLVHTVMLSAPLFPQQKSSFFAKIRAPETLLLVHLCCPSHITELNLQHILYCVCCI